MGLIRESHYSLRTTNLVMAQKKNKKWRMCVDFTYFNRFCLKDLFPIPKIDKLVDSTSGNKLLSFMDAFDGYNHIQMDQNDEESNTFITGRELYFYKIMHFGLKNTGATYKILVNKKFANQIGRNVEVYIDDILVKSMEDEDHFRDLEENFGNIERVNLKLNLEKYTFGVRSGKFLGYIVSEKGVEVYQEQLEELTMMMSSESINEVHNLTGRLIALNGFISKSSDKYAPFFNMLKNKSHFNVMKLLSR